jgi:hypothetical protein
VPRIGTLPLTVVAARGPPCRPPEGRERPCQLAVGIETTGSPVPCQRLQRTHATYTPDTTRATRRQLPGRGNAPKSAPWSRDMRASRFRCHQKPFDASAVVHTRSSSRHLPDPLITGRFRSRFPPRLLTDMTLRRFGTSACSAIPEDLPPSLAQHGSCWRSSTSSPLPFQDTPRTRLTDAVHRPHSVAPARTCPPWARRRFHTG